MKNEELKKEIKWYAVFFGILLVVSILITNYFGLCFIYGVSMEPNIYEGEVYVDKKVKNTDEIERFDVIAFNTAEEGEDEFFYVKRVIGLPGETIQIDEDGVIYIDGEVLKESYGKETIKDAGLAAEEITLGSDEFFCLGDNRNNSTDSRDPYVGNVRLDQDVRLFYFQVYPISDFGLVEW